MSAEPRPGHAPRHPFLCWELWPRQGLSAVPPEPSPPNLILGQGPLQRPSSQTFPESRQAGPWSPPHAEGASYKAEADH